MMWYNYSMINNLRIKLGDFLMKLGRKIHPVCVQVDNSFLKLKEKSNERNKKNKK